MDSMKYFLVILVYLGIVMTAVSQDNPPQRKTNSGIIEGYLKKAENTTVEVYLAVPYAEAPIGKRRFKKPEKVKPWTGVKEAKTLGYACIQGYSNHMHFYPADLRWLPITEQNEDCLTLNIWNPVDKPENASVIVYIHGGTFVRGTSMIDLYDGATLAAYGQVIVVTLNYRLGALGFLYLGNKAAPGNQGLWDQKMAIEWVKENIGYFGGNPDSITLYGQSSGAMAVAAHILSPESRELFSGGILQSGSVNAPSATLTKWQSKYFAKNLIKDAGCDKENMKSSLECLKTTDAKVLSKLQMKLYEGSAVPYVPTIDGEFLPDHPLKMLSAGEHGKQNILIGNVPNEGTYLLLRDPRLPFNDQTAIPFPRNVLHTLYDQLGADLGSDQKLAIKYEYTDWTANFSIDNQLLLADAVGDRIFLCPNVDFAKKLYKKENTVYYYYFTQKTSSLPWGDWLGVVHRAVTEYAFGLPRNMSKSYTQPERELSARIMQYYTDFAKHGNPTPNNGAWPVYSEANPRYMLLNGVEKGTGIGPKSKQCALWNWFIPSMSS